MLKSSSLFFFFFFHFRISNWIPQIPAAEGQSAQALAEHSQPGHVLFGLLWVDTSGQLPGTVGAYILPGRSKTLFYSCSVTVHLQLVISSIKAQHEPSGALWPEINGLISYIEYLSQREHFHHIT